MLHQLMAEEKLPTEVNMEIPAEYYIVDVFDENNIIDLLYLEPDLEDKVSKTPVTSDETNFDLSDQSLVVNNISKINYNGLNSHVLIPPLAEAGILLQDVSVEHKTSENTNAKVSSTLQIECGTCKRSVVLSESTLKQKQMMFKCKHCNVLFCNQVLVQEHEIEVHSYKYDNCSQCISEFCKQTQPNIALDRTAAMAEMAKCILCNKEFKRLYDLKIHMNVHLGTKAHTCDICGKCFSHSSNLNCHKRIHTGEKPYVCRLCNRGFRQVTALIGHELSHSEGLSCSFCSSKFKNIIGLIRHSSNAHNFHMTSKSAYKMAKELLQKQRHGFYCSTCGDRFRTKKYLNNHMSVDHSNECRRTNSPGLAPSIVNVPGTLDDSAENQVLHLFDFIEESGDPSLRQDSELSIARSNGEQFSVDEFPPSKEDIILETCSTNENQKIDDPDDNRTYDNYYKIREFLSDFTVPPRMEAERTATTVKSSRKTNTDVNSIKKLVCGECGKRFSRQWHYKLHLSVHDPSLRRYSCHQCRERFVYHTSLERHLKKHSDITVNYSCLVCGKNYKSGDALRNHNNCVHKGKVNHTCPYCPKSFFSSTEYKYHLRLHRKESPFMCSSCGKRFSHVSHLHRHEKIHSGIRPHACSLCPKAFIQAGELRIHMKRHEKKGTKVAEKLRQINNSETADSQLGVHSGPSSIIRQESLSFYTMEPDFPIDGQCRIADENGDALTNYVVTE